MGAGPKLIRLHFVVEGQTEETFVRDILAPQLAEQSVLVDAHKITTGRRKGTPFRGGFVAYDHLRRDLRLWMKQESSSEVRFTTMIDLYGLPSEFPGLDKCRTQSDPFEKVQILESELASDLGDYRLIPYIQLHEFEALLFADPDAFSSAFPENDSKIAELRRIRNKSTSPEHIDGGADSAPSKRICKLLPGYAKTSHGLMIAKTVGLMKMRSECRHFDAWITRLLQLTNQLNP